MECTVKELSKLSNVSIRTLHFYDEIGLLKPAYYGNNGYRYYSEEELLKLQQILFFRKLGFRLKHIKDILNSSDFNKIAALTSHKKVLEKSLTKTRELIATIDKTINHLKGVKKMNSKEIYWGFDNENQTKYENELIERFGDEIKESISESHKKVKNYSKEKWDEVQEEFERICTDLSQLMKENYSETSDKVQEVVRRHYLWLKNFWTPTKVTYPSHGQLILESGLKKAYDMHHPKLAEFLVRAIGFFAESKL